jgi:hypothetical protein
MNTLSPATLSSMCRELEKRSFILIPITTRHATPYGEEVARQELKRSTPERRKELLKGFTLQSPVLGSAVGALAGTALGGLAHSKGAPEAAMPIGALLGAVLGVGTGAGVGAWRHRRAVETGEVPYGSHLSILDELGREKAKAQYQG